MKIEFIKIYLGTQGVCFYRLNQEKKEDIMREAYQRPELELVEFEAEDVITTSTPVDAESQEAEDDL